MHRNAPQCTAMHHHAPQCTAMHRHAPPCTAMHRNAPPCTAMHRHAPPCTAMHRHAPPCTAMHRHAPPCAATARIDLLSLFLTFRTPLHVQTALNDHACLFVFRAENADRYSGAVPYIQNSTSCAYCRKLPCASFSVSAAVGHRPAST